MWMKEWWRGLSFVLSIIFLPAVLFTAVPDVIITLLYGQSFAKAASSLRFLGPATFVLCLGFIFGIALTSIGHEKHQLKITFLALVSNVFLNMWLIPLYGGVGAAIATLIAGLVYIVLGLLTLKGAIKNRQREDGREIIDGNCR
jgi:O-antigen/teichoic acid export membrane protein